MPRAAADAGDLAVEAGESRGSSFSWPGREKRTRPDPPLDTPTIRGSACGRMRRGGGSLFRPRAGGKEILGRLLDPPGRRFWLVGAPRARASRASCGPVCCPRSKNLSRRRLAADRGPGRWCGCRASTAIRGRSSTRRCGSSPRLPRETRASLLFIDQFEELYTQCRDGEARESFLRAPARR